MCRLWFAGIFFTYVIVIPLLSDCCTVFFNKTVGKLPLIFVRYTWVPALRASHYFLRIPEGLETRFSWVFFFSHMLICKTHRQRNESKPQTHLASSHSYPVFHVTPSLLLLLGHLYGLCEWTSSWQNLKLHLQYMAGFTMEIYSRNCKRKPTGRGKMHGSGE